MEESSSSRALAPPRASTFKDDIDSDALFDDDDEYPGLAPSEGGALDAVSLTPDQRASRVAERTPGGGGFGFDDDELLDDVDASGFDAGVAGGGGVGGGRGGADDEEDDGWFSSKSSAAQPSPSRSTTTTTTRDDGSRGGLPRWADDADIISAGDGAPWFENDEEWYEPEYKDVDAAEGSVLEMVQRLHLRRPKDYNFEDGEYFDMTGFVKDNTDNQFALVLEVAERARERKLESLEALNPIPPGAALPPIQQAIVDLALEVEASGGKTSAFLALREAADRARLRWELQEAALAWDNYCEEFMPELGVSERAARLLHMGRRVEDAMDFEKDLATHNDDYNMRKF